MNQNVEIKGARIHNLRNIDVTIPKNRLTVITGVSGSGKSSLAFDTLYEEGRKRYLMFSGTQLMVESEISVDDIRGLSQQLQLSSGLSGRVILEVQFLHAHKSKHCYHHFLQTLE